MPPLPPPMTDGSKKPMSNRVNLAKRWGFTSFIQDTKIIVDLKLLTMLRAQGKKLNLV